MTKLTKQQGLTLIEVVLSLGILALVGTAIVSFGRDIFWQNYVWSQHLIAETEAKLALRRLMTELRTVEPSSTGTYPLELATKNNLIFYSDINDDGRRERLRYFLEGTTLKRGQTSVSGQPYVYATGTESVAVVINNLINESGLIFSYYDNNYDGTEGSLPLTEPLDLKDIRLIKVQFLIDNNPLQSPGPLYLSSQVMLRNLKDNL